MSISTEKIENAAVGEMQEILKESDVVFTNRTNKLGTIEVLFKSEKVARKYTTENLITEKWKLFPIYMGQEIVRV